MVQTSIQEANLAIGWTLRQWGTYYRIQEGERRVILSVVDPVRPKPSWKNDGTPQTVTPKDEAQQGIAQVNPGLTEPKGSRRFWGHVGKPI